MGFFGHLVASQGDASALWAEAEPEPGAWSKNLHVLRVFEQLGGEWEPLQDLRTRLAERLPGGFLAASVWHSDGALLVIGVPGQQVGRYWISIDRVVGHFLPWTPFGEDGTRLSPEAEAVQDAEWEAEAAAYRDEMLQLAVRTSHAAELCVAWADYNELIPGGVGEVRRALASNNVFVEDTFNDLLAVLEPASSRHLDSARICR